MPGRFATHARPEQSHPFSITRIRPSAEIVNESNVYVAEVEMIMPAGWIRPGMEGTSKVYAGARPVWWVTFHRLIDYLRMTLWL